MKYFRLDEDYDNYPEGSGIEKSAGILLEDEGTIEKFWAHYHKRIVTGRPISIPKFDYLIYKKKFKTPQQDFLGNLFNIGLIISKNFKEIIDNHIVPEKIVERITIKYKNIVIDNYFFFSLCEATVEAIDFERSYFYERENLKLFSPLSFYNDKIFKIQNSAELIKLCNETKFGIMAYKINLREDKLFDIISLRTLIKDDFLFSERIVQQLKNLINVKFKEVEKVAG